MPCSQPSTHQADKVTMPCSQPATHQADKVTMPWMQPATHPPGRQGDYAVRVVDKDVVLVRVQVACLDQVGREVVGKVAPQGKPGVWDGGGEQGVVWVGGKEWCGWGQGVGLGGGGAKVWGGVGAKREVGGGKVYVGGRARCVCVWGGRCVGRGARCVCGGGRMCGEGGNVWGVWGQCVGDFNRRVEVGGHTSLWEGLKYAAGCKPKEEGWRSVRECVCDGENTVGGALLAHMHACTLYAYACPLPAYASRTLTRSCPHIS